ncbi:hypothetical protein Pogu_2251 [Pyrobaculum oguniense TE7]|uniref:Uncharacterized protein n=1 Tax=Pyrobaculum oguniense (strain DSM 13380 / JCM 10595 / TE7) TaxID=698757 RepID=H6QD10_PYROT|nr:hypothetical protein Pogu_2251 [Pyrobaculum oguniense TE7]
MSDRLKLVLSFTGPYLGASIASSLHGLFLNWLFYSQVAVLHFLLVYLLAETLRLWRVELNIFVQVTTAPIFFLWFGAWLEHVRNSTDPINVGLIGFLIAYTTAVNVIAWERASWAYRLGVFGLGAAALALLRLVRPAPYALLSVFFALLFSAGYVSRFGRVPLRVYAAAVASAAAALTAPDEAAVVATAAPYVALAVHQLLTRRGEVGTDVGSTPQKTPASSSLAYGVV